MNPEVSKPPFVVQTAPERVWIQISDDEHDGTKCFPDDHAEITWCQDSVMDVEVKHLRADLVAELIAADLEYDEAFAYSGEPNMNDAHPVVMRRKAAVARRAAALARIAPHGEGE